MLWKSLLQKSLKIKAIDYTKRTVTVNYSEDKARKSNNVINRGVFKQY